MAASRTISRRPRAKRTRAQVKSILEAALRHEFPHDTVDISDGYEENIHVLVVSREFDNVRNSIRQDRIWKIIDQTTLTSDEKQLISLVYPISIAEIK